MIESFVQVTKGGTGNQEKRKSIGESDLITIWRVLLTHRSSLRLAPGNKSCLSLEEIGQPLGGLVAAILRYARVVPDLHSACIHRINLERYLEGTNILCLEDETFPCNGRFDKSHLWQRPLAHKCVLRIDDHPAPIVQKAERRKSTPRQRRALAGLDGVNVDLCKFDHVGCLVEEPALFHNLFFAVVADFIVPKGVEVATAWSMVTLEKVFLPGPSTRCSAPGAEGLSILAVGRNLFMHRYGCVLFKLRKVKRFPFA